MATKKQTTQTVRTLPSSLSMQRLFVISDASFWNMKPDGDTPVMVRRHGIRATQNVVSIQDAESAADETRDARNLQTIETAKLDNDAIGLKIKFGIKFIDLEHTISACADADRNLVKKTREGFKAFISKLKADNSGLDEVCRRMARNVANGSFTWRNRIYASSIQVEVMHAGKKICNFNALGYKLNRFEDYDAQEIELAEIFKRGLLGDITSGVEITATLKFGVKGSVEVFPSQPYLEKGKKDNDRSVPSRSLYTLTNTKPSKVLDKTDGVEIIGQAALRDAKASNRIKCIDTWYPEFDDIQIAIPIEPCGASLDLVTLFRDAQGPNAESSAFHIVPRIAECDPNTPEGMYLTGILIRGGVLPRPSDKGKKDKTAKASKPSDAAKEVKEDAAEITND
jgi:CRISPR-associated protein Csy3